MVVFGLNLSVTNEIIIKGFASQLKVAPILLLKIVSCPCTFSIIKVAMCPSSSKTPNQPKRKAAIESPHWSPKQ